MKSCLSVKALEVWYVKTDWSVMPLFIWLSEPNSVSQFQNISKVVLMFYNKRFIRCRKLLTSVKKESVLS